MISNLETFRRFIYTYVRKFSLLYFFYIKSYNYLLIVVKIYLTQILYEVCNDIVSLFWFVAKGIFGDKAILIASG